MTQNFSLLTYFYYILITG